MSTTARADGVGYVVNGSKTWITNARRAGVIALMVKTDPALLGAEEGRGFAQMMRGLETGRIRVTGRSAWRPRSLTAVRGGAGRPNRRA